jgi:organic radical activating enzyme
LTSSTRAPQGTARDRVAAGLLRVSEIFGPTLQGEGPSAGQLAAFVRLGMCNLDCRWCDTPYTWDRRRYDLDAALRWTSAGNAWQEVAATGAGLLVITGGEPLIQQAALPPLLDAAGRAGWRVEIETNGTIRPLPTVIRPFVRFNVSVKLAGSGVAEGRRIRPIAIRALAAAGQVTWKFVVDQAGDIGEIARLQDQFGLDPVWVMPQGTTAAQVLGRLPQLAEHALAHRWHLTPRLHILLWGDARGR